MMAITHRFLLFITLLWMVFFAAAQGPVTPPAAPGATMKSLDQIYSEIAKLAPANPLLVPDALDPKTQGVIHMTARGAQQGDIEGESTLKGFEKSMVCLGFSHEIVSPRDPASGLPTGTRRHKPTRVCDSTDKTITMILVDMRQYSN